MGNLFLKERESWPVWFVLSLFGGALGVVLEYELSASWANFSGPAILLILSAVWMNYTKRFNFVRAFKIFLFLLSLSTLILIGNELLIGKFDILKISEYSIGTIGLLLISLICAAYAKKPKEYY